MPSSTRTRKLRRPRPPKKHKPLHNNSSMTPIQKQLSKPQKNTPVANQDSSDEEVDELEIANKQLNYANIKETNHSADNKAGDEKKLGFGFEEKKKADEVAPLTRQPKKFGDG